MPGKTALIELHRQAPRGQDHSPSTILTRTDGSLLPMGAAWVEAERAYNFSLYAQHAESVVLLLFAEDDPAHPLLEYRLDPRVNKTWNVWHCRLGRSCQGARYYAYRIDGPRAAGPGSWHAYDPEKVLLDPYAKEVFFPPEFDREAARRPGPNLGRAPLGVLPRATPGPRPGARPAAPARVERGDHLRDARPRLHAEPDQRRRARTEGHLRGRRSTRSRT